MEFQPVVMAAGRGSRMVDITSKIPKALLPLGNLPMLWYPLNMLERNGFEEAIVIVLTSQKKDVLVALSLCNLNIKWELVGIPDDQDFGTADSLRFISDKINSDVLVISSDLITDVQLHLLADVHRMHDAAITTLLSTVPQSFTETVPPGPKSKKKVIERDIFGIDAKTGNRLVLMGAEADFEKTVDIRKSVLKRFPHIVVHSRYIDGHLYLMKKSVIDFLVLNKNISSIKGELIPCLVKKQFSHNKNKSQQLNDESNSAEALKADSFSAPEDPLLEFALKMSTSAVSQVGKDISNVKCYAHVMKDGLCIRANTLATYSEINRQISKFLALWLAEKQSLVHQSAKVESKSQVGQDCMIGDGTVIQEKASVKRSVIGKHCSIGEKVKIANSVIMDHVIIKEGSSLHNCIIGHNVHVDEKAELKDCLVSAKQHVTALAKLSHEAVVDIDRLMEFDLT